MESLEDASLKVTGMTCADCSARVEDFLARLAAIKKFNVSLLAEKVKIQFNPSECTLDDIVAGIDRLGFTASRLSAGSSAVLRLVVQASAAVEVSLCLLKLPGVSGAEAIASTRQHRLCSRSRAENNNGNVTVTYDPESVGARAIFSAAQAAAARMMAAPLPATATFPSRGALPPGRPQPVVSLLDSSSSAAPASSGSGQADMMTRLYVGIAAGIASTVLAYAIPKMGGAGAAGTGLDRELAPLLTPRGLVQLVLATIVMAVIGAPIAASAWAAAVQSRMMTMDTLVTASSGAAYLFSVGMLIAARAGAPPTSLSEPIFETTVVLLALVMVGRAIEHTAKKRTGAALARLTALAAEDAQLAVSADTPVPAASAAAIPGSAASSSRSGAGCGSMPAPSGDSPCGASSGAGAVASPAAAGGCCSGPSAASTGDSCCSAPAAAVTEGCCTAKVPAGDSCCSSGGGAEAGPTACAAAAAPSCCAASASPCCSATTTTTAAAVPLPLRLPMTISPSLLHLGDVVTVPPRARFPADGIISSGMTTADESAVTGESLPVPKAAGDAVIGGTVNGDGVVSVRITALPGSGAVSRIVALIEEVQGQKPAVQRKADVVASYFTPAIFAVAVAAWVLWFILASRGVVTPPGGTPPGAFALLFALTLLVVSCPCAISLAVPTAVMVATQVGARMGALIKGGPCLESLAGVTAVVLDKTGTVTAGTPDIADVYLAAPPRIVAAAVKSAGLSVEALPAAAAAASLAVKLPLGVKLGPGELALLAAAAFAERGSQHPLARALCSFADAVCTSTLRARPGAAAASATGASATSGCSASAVGGGSDDGAERTTLPGLGIACQLPNTSSSSGAVIHVGALSFVMGPAVGANIEDGDEDELHEAATRMQAHGMSIVAVSVSRSVVGLLGFRDHLRPSAAAAVADLHARGITVWLASGDNQGAVDAAARELAIPPLFARGGLSPADKAALVRGVQRRMLHATASPAAAEAAASAAGSGAASVGAAVAADTAESGATGGSTASSATPRGRYFAAAAAAGVVTADGFIDFDAVDALASRQRATHAAATGYCSRRAWSAFLCGGSGAASEKRSRAAHASAGPQKSETTALLAAAHGSLSPSPAAKGTHHIDVAAPAAADGSHHPFQPLLECGGVSHGEIAAARLEWSSQGSTSFCSSIGRLLSRVLCCGRRRAYTAITPGGDGEGAPRLASRVLFAGDGINDVVALAQADVAVALGSGTAIAVDAADVVIMHNDLTALGGLLDLSAARLQRISTNFAWAAVYNAIAMPLAGGALYPFIHALAIPPALAGISELLSSVPVVLGSLLLFRWAPPSHYTKAT